MLSFIKITPKSRLYLEKKLIGFDNYCCILCDAYLKKASMLKHRRQQKLAAQLSTVLHLSVGRRLQCFGSRGHRVKKSCLAYHDQLDLMILAVQYFPQSLIHIRSSLPEVNKFNRRLEAFSKFLAPEQRLD